MTVRRTNIDDVAALAGVHKATVSRALNEATRNKVSSATVRKVQRAAQKLGYVPNAMARGLRTNLSMTVGVMIPDLTNPIFPPIVRGIENFLQPRGYTALVANTDGHESVEHSAFNSLWERRVDGFIIATGRLDDPWLTQVYETGVHIVMVNRFSGAAPYPQVTGSDASGVAAGLAHLFQLGHREIVHLAGPQNFSTSLARANAFNEICAAQPGASGRIVQAAALSIEAGEHATDDLLTDARRVPTAIFAGNDLLALGALRSLRGHGLRCPQDVSVVGFNDMPFSEDFCPPLTTVRVPLHDIGSEAARLLLGGFEVGTQEAMSLSLPVSLIVRSSTSSIL